ncbi:dipeptidase PepE [Rheinheimera sp. UJ51]|uniref:dipeptidase PepE n=1 Tax=Rheinheimera sp. UJ51 TaxID=2892446 RepID=UPI001E640B97|nr:dipeptidase PepE [Rheinheimera sp. UJ51]MCC5451716.1 dipeptidase PepE [Rheinheimera sp. UJ51]
MNLLLLSSSRANNSDYLTPNLAWIKTHLSKVSSVLFIPYAGVTISHEQYYLNVKAALASLNIRVVALHHQADVKAAVLNAEAILIGGGNTFQLVNLLYKNDLINAIRQRVTEGMPYIGWSAGANIAGETIRTTNDMPIVEPSSFATLHFLNAQLNPHYTDVVPADFHGETRDMRLAEFMQLNPSVPVIGLPEGTALKITDNQIVQLGQAGGYWFLAGTKQAIAENTELTAQFAATLSRPLLNHAS